MTETLQKIYPEKDYSCYKVSYSEGQDIEAEVRASLSALLKEYLSVQEKMTAEEFKASVIAWASKALKHYSTYR